MMDGTDLQVHGLQCAERSSREAIEEAFRAVAGEHKVRVRANRLCIFHERNVSVTLRVRRETGKE